jgi:phosphonate transport system permease protein
VITALSLSERFGIGLELGELIDGATHAVFNIEQMLDPNWDFLEKTWGPLIETFRMAVVSSVIGCSIALPFSFLASRTTSPNRVTLTVTRSILSVIRAIPDFLYALIFVAAVGIGSLPGIAALVFFNLGVVAKLLSETVDGVDTGPIEAARAAGGGRMQTTRWAVLPQVLPNYIAFSLYAFELNIRASTVIGFVGAGGIGALLFTQYSFLRWDNVAIIIIELFFLVVIIEIISIRLRRRLV